MLLSAQKINQVDIDKKIFETISEFNNFFGIEFKDVIVIIVDLKTFYASVECMERNLNPLRTNLVVADNSRTEKTICLAVSPSLKQYGIPGRARLFEVIQKVREVNANRKYNAPGHVLKGKSLQECINEMPDYIFPHLQREYINNDKGK